MGLEMLNKHQRKLFPVITNERESKVSTTTKSETTELIHFQNINAIRRKKNINEYIDPNSLRLYNNSVRIYCLTSGEIIV